MQNKIDFQSLNPLFDHLPDSVYLIDPDSSNIIYCNRLGYQSLQMKAEEVLNHSVLSIQEDVLGAPAWKEIVAQIRSVETFTFIGSHRRKDKSCFPVEVNTSSFNYQGNEFFLSIARDITKRCLNNEEILDRDQMLWYVLNETSDGLWDWNIISEEVFFSPQLKQMLGYGPDEMPPHVSTWSDNIHPEDSQRVLRIISEHIEGKRKCYEAEYRLKNRNGHYLWVHDRGKISARNELGEPSRMVGMVQNITDRKNLEHRLQQMASHDDLTGIINRREGEMIFEKQLDLCKRLNLHLGICLFDLDHFKQINDQHGHLIGDEVLKTMVQLIGNNIRKLDYFYRWGGEEFVILCPDTSLDKLIFIAEKLRHCLESFDWETAHGIAQVTASFGLSVYPTHGKTAHELFLNADAAMYQAKSQGRNRTTYHQPDSK